MTKTKEILKKNTMLIALVVIMLLFQVLISAAGKGSLFAPANVTNLILQNSYVVILAVGMLLCILTGGNIDLSVGSVVALVGAIAGVMIVNHKMNVYLTIITCLLMGILIGAWQGFWIAYVRIPAFIVTLAGMMLWRGLALIVLDGLTISPFPDEYLRYFSSFLPGSGAEKSLVFGVTLAVGAILCAVYVVQQLAERNKKARKNYELAPAGMLWGRLVLICAVAMALSFLLGKNKGIPVVLILLGVIVLVYSYYTQNTVPGRYLYAMGGNEKAARLSGIDTKKVYFWVYTNMGFLAAIAGIVLSARNASATPKAGDGFELDAIAACYIGGAAASGGVGTIVGAVIGAFVMGILNNGMFLIGLPTDLQKVVKGLVLLGAVTFDVLSSKKKN